MKRYRPIRKGKNRRSYKALSKGKYAKFRYYSSESNRRLLNRSLFS